MQTVFDNALSIARKKRALKIGDEDAWFLMQRVADDLEARLATVDRRFPHAATLFCATDHACRILQASGKVDSVLRVETDEGLLGDGDGEVAPPETVPLAPESLDLAVSLMALQEVNDVPGLLVQIRRALRPDGLFLGAMAGAGTLDELRASLLAAETEIASGAAPRVHPFADVRDVGGLMQRAGFALPVTDLEIVTVRYDSMFALIRDLRAMGATSILEERSRTPTRQALFLRAAEIYAERFADADGRIRATFQIVWMSGWAPDASQQKPLRPGSAKVSMASVLGGGGTTKP